MSVAAGVNEDPAGDDYQAQYNPTGTENDHRFTSGEAFDDTGLDGVPGTAFLDAARAGVERLPRARRVRFELVDTLVRTFLTAAYEATGLRRRGQMWHALRHTYASVLAAGGVESCARASPFSATVTWRRASSDR